MARVDHNSPGRGMEYLICDHVGPHERAQAVCTVASYAADAAELAELLAMLDLDPKEATHD